MIEQIVTHAATRGLWIGAFPKITEEFATAIEFVRDVNSDTLESDQAVLPHVTIAHLGKSNTRRTVEQAYAALEMACSGIYGHKLISIEGILRLPRHLTFALAPNPVMQMRLEVWNALYDRSIKPDDSFAGIPHLTIGRLKKANDIPRAPNIQPITLRVSELIMICGDAHIKVPFSEPPF